jgi:hypothetical protein
MTEDRGRVVWILGAGFSKSLGGPLLPDLLSERSRVDAVARFGKPLAEHAGRVYPIFRKHAAGPEGARNGLPVYWEHAEEFLDFVDTAANGHAARQALFGTEMASFGFSELRDSAKRVVAAECEITSLVDLSNTATMPEAWQPYLYWMQQVKRTDSLITFNYDLVLETLGEAAGPKAPGKETVFGVEGYTNDKVAAQIFKMHGSIDWSERESNGAPFVQNPDPRAQITSKAGPLIAMPGPSKKLHCTTSFDGIWQQATEALSRAAVVVFVGYRFPPSDSESRTRLLAALRRNSSDRGLRVHTVLGPNTGERDTIRLRELLRQTLSERHVEVTNNREYPKRGHFQVIVHPLFAEDFFTVFHEDMLFGHEIPSG